MFNLEIQNKNDSTFITSDQLLKNSVQILFTTRNTGVSKKPFDSLNLGFRVGDENQDVIKNREIVSQTFDYKASSLTCAEQVHGNNVRFVETDEKGAGSLEHETAIKGVDALATDKDNLPIAMFFADCLPVVLVSLKPKTIAIAHAGYKGLLGNIVERLAKQLGSKTANGELFAFLGPAIGPCCYHADDERIAKFHAVFPEAVDINDKTLDLKRIATWQLEKNGVEPKNIFNADYCTSCRTDLFYSYRKEKETGRQSAIALIRGQRTKGKG